MASIIVDLFMSSENIQNIRNKLSTELPKFVDNKTTEIVINDLITDMYDYDCYSVLNNSKSNVRNTTNISSELNNLNNAFIDDRITFAKNINLYSQNVEDYGMQMFIDDSLHLNRGYNDPLPDDYYESDYYESNDNINCSKECFNSDSDSDSDVQKSSFKNKDNRIFRYQDKYDTNRSAIPIWQINKRGYTDYTNQDELRNSDTSQVRSVPGPLSVDRLSSLVTNVPKWIDM